MNKNIYIICGLTVLLCSMLACMTTVEPFITDEPDETPDGKSALTAVPAASLSQEPEAGAVFEIQITARCATVTAMQSLHVRQAPTEKSAVVAYLHNGEQVTVLHSAGQWWKIETPTAEGWSNADYLQEAECQ